MSRTVLVIQSKKELVDMLPDGSIAIVEQWLARGDGVACYQNMALDSANLGHRKFTSFGSAKAQLETDDPPDRLPDIGGQINWPYQLFAVYREVP